MMKPLRPAREVLSDWAPDLSRKLGRSEVEIRSKGIGGLDFVAGHSVEVRYPAGLVMKFPLAFAVLRPDVKQAAVFSEHDGYVEFELVEDAVVAEIHEDIYRQR
jgi:hypothetical protein